MLRPTFSFSGMRPFLIVKNRCIETVGLDGHAPFGKKPVVDVQCKPRFRFCPAKEDYIVAVANHLYAKSLGHNVVHLVEVQVPNQTAGICANSHTSLSLPVHPLRPSLFPLRTSSQDSTSQKAV